MKADLGRGPRLPPNAAIATAKVPGGLRVTDSQESDRWTCWGGGAKDSRCQNHPRHHTDVQPPEGRPRPSAPPCRPGNRGRQQNPPVVAEGISKVTSAGNQQACVCLYPEPVGVSVSRLAHKDLRPPIQIHGVRRALEADDLRLRLAAVVEGHLILKDRQGEAGPRVHQARHPEAGGLVRSLGVGLGVEELHLLAARLLAAQLHAHVHQLLRPVGDGEEHGGGGRGWSDVEDQGEVAVERVGHVGQRRLTRHGFGTEAEAELPPQPGGPVELGRRRVSDQLEQRDAAFSCGEGSEVRTRVRLRAAEDQQLHHLQKSPPPKVPENPWSASLSHASLMMSWLFRRFHGYSRGSWRLFQV